MTAKFEEEKMNEFQVRTRNFNASFLFLTAKFEDQPMENDFLQYFVNLKKEVSFSRAQYGSFIVA